MADEPLAPGLHLVGTPIGNLEDITLRALRVLKSADRIACEDTRQSQKLLNHFSITTPTVSCHEHNEARRTEELVVALKNGARIAVISDAGMPGISDPGMHLARAAVEAGIAVYPIPGANAAVSALVASGLDTERFFYAGFLPSKTGERRAMLEQLAATFAERTTLIFYEAPHRILETLSDVEAVWGAGCRAVVARELTKLHEEFLRGTVAGIRQELASRERVRGEITLLVGAERSPAGGTEKLSLAQRVAELEQMESLSSMDALKRAARERGMSKSEAYRELQRKRGAR